MVLSLAQNEWPKRETKRERRKGYMVKRRSILVVLLGSFHVLCLTYVIRRLHLQLSMRLSVSKLNGIAFPTKDQSSLGHFEVVNRTFRETRIFKASLHLVNIPSDDSP